MSTRPKSVSFNLLRNMFLLNLWNPLTAVCPPEVVVVVVVVVAVVAVAVRGARVGVGVGVALVVAIVVVVVVVAVVVVIAVVGGKGAAPPPQCKQSLDSSFVGDQMWFAGCLFGRMVQIKQREEVRGRAQRLPRNANKVACRVCKGSLWFAFCLQLWWLRRACWLLAQLRSPNSKAGGGAGEGAAPPPQCKQSLDSSCVGDQMLFAGKGSLWFAFCLQLWWLRRVRPERPDVVCWLLARLRGPNRTAGSSTMQAKCSCNRHDLCQRHTRRLVLVSLVVLLLPGCGCGK